MWLPHSYFCLSFWRFFCIAQDLEKFFIDLALGAAGRFVGGPAKVAVLAKWFLAQFPDLLLPIQFQPELYHPINEKRGLQRRICGRS